MRSPQECEWVLVGWWVRVDGCVCVGVCMRMQTHTFKRRFTAHTAEPCILLQVKLAQTQVRQPQTLKSDAKP